MQKIHARTSLDQENVCAKKIQPLHLTLRSQGPEVLALHLPVDAFGVAGKVNSSTNDSISIGLTATSMEMLRVCPIRPRGIFIELTKHGTARVLDRD